MHPTPTDTSPYGRSDALSSRVNISSSRLLGTPNVSEGGLQPASLGSNPAHLIVYTVEPPIAMRWQGRRDASVCLRPPGLAAEASAGRSSTKRLAYRVGDVAAVGGLSTPGLEYVQECPRA